MVNFIEVTVVYFWYDTRLGKTRANEPVKQIFGIRDIQNVAPIKAEDKKHYEGCNTQISFRTDITRPITVVETYEEIRKLLIGDQK